MRGKATALAVNGEAADDAEARGLKRGPAKGGPGGTAARGPYLPSVSSRTSEASVGIYSESACATHGAVGVDPDRPCGLRDDKGEGA